MNSYMPFANSFLSCSLRKEDEQFVKFVSAILKQHDIRPFGTVGKFEASPENPVDLIREKYTKSRFSC